MAYDLVTIREQFFEKVATNKSSSSSEENFHYKILANPNEKTTRRWFWYYLVARGGIEPPTQGFSRLSLTLFHFHFQRVRPTGKNSVIHTKSSLISKCLILHNYSTDAYCFCVYTTDTSLSFQTTLTDAEISNPGLLLSKKGGNKTKFCLRRLFGHRLS